MERANANSTGSETANPSNLSTRFGCNSTGTDQQAEGNDPQMHFVEI